MTPKNNFDDKGIALCSLYAYPPNSLHYCGPEKQVNLKSYIKEHAVDMGLVEIIRKFETLYPYLMLIAQANNIKDPFDKRVIEAYWIGNKLLENVTKNSLFKHLSAEFMPKLPHKAKKNIEVYTEDGYPYHTFHVLNIFKRTGHVSLPQTLETIDSCRISWGTVIGQSNPENYLVMIQPLRIYGNMIKLGKLIPKNFTSIQMVLKKGDSVSLHWGYICQKLNQIQLQNLKMYTSYALGILNQHGL